MTKDNLRLWVAHENIDPKYTKAITGKQYRGTSPSPQHVIWCLTDLFGPVGQGFGWRVLSDSFETLGDTVLHWCRIEFWHTDRANTFEAYGQTKAAYPTSGGKMMVDEDAPKKSLTDAIIKAASQIGIAANIFLGRWDDQKYVQEVNAEYREAEREATKQPPRNQAQDTPQKRDMPKPQDNMTDNRKDNALWSIKHAATLDDLKITWDNFDAETKGNREVKAATNKRKSELMG